MRGRPPERLTNTPHCTGYRVLSVAHVTVGHMDNRADQLLLGSVVSVCGDCLQERIFVPVDADCDSIACEFCCTVCGAAVLIDPLFRGVEDSLWSHSVAV